MAIKKSTTPSCFKVKHGLCVTGDSYLTGDLTLTGDFNWLNPGAVLTVSDTSTNNLSAGRLSSNNDELIDVINGTDYTIIHPLSVVDETVFESAVQMESDLWVKGNLRVDGNAYLSAGINGVIRVGDSSTDNIVFNAEIDSDIIPDKNMAYDLGSMQQHWMGVYTHNLWAHGNITWAGGTSIQANDTTSVVQSNSAEWESGGGGAGAFITSVTCGDNASRSDGISQLVEDTDEIAVGSARPITSGLFDNSSLRFYVQWEGPADEWTGTPLVSGYTIPRSETTAIGGSHTRRFEGYIDIDLDDYAGQTIDIPYTYSDLTKTLQVQIAGSGPEITNIAMTSVFPHGQDHYKSGDTITFEVEFNTNDVVSYTLEGGNGTLTSSQSNQSVTMNGLSATIQATVETTLTSITDVPIKIKVKNALGTEGPLATSSILTSAMSGPVITGAVFGNTNLNGNPVYPNTQTELADGNQTYVTLTFDTNNVDKIQFDGNGNNNYANDNSLVNVNVTGKQALVLVNIDTSLQYSAVATTDRPIKMKAKKQGQSYGPFMTSTNKVYVNNQSPTINGNFDIIYPVGTNGQQSALKDVEVATVKMVVTNEGPGATYLYTAPGSQLSPASNLDWSNYSEEKIVTRIDNTGENLTGNNFKLSVTRISNGRSSSVNKKIIICPAAAICTIVTNNGSKMRTGGNDGTASQPYTVSITSTQPLLQSPTLDVSNTSAGSLGPFSGGVNGPWTGTITVHDDNDKGTQYYNNLSAINAAGIEQTTISTGDSYEIGGFVNRTVNVLPGQSETEINVLWTDYSKLTLTWSAGIALTQAPAGQSAQATGKWCIADQLTSGTGTVPITIRILDYSAAGSWTQPSTITIQETL